MIQLLQKYLQEKTDLILERIHRKSQERLTIMVIPHNHDRIFSHQLSWLMIYFLLALTVIVVVMAGYSYYHRNRLKSDVDRLKDLYGLNYSQANTLHDQAGVTRDLQGQLQENMEEITGVIGIPAGELAILRDGPAPSSRAEDVLYREVTSRLDMAPGTNYLPSVYSIKTNYYRMEDNYPLMASIHEFLDQGLGVYSEMPIGRPFKSFKHLRDTSPFGMRIDPVTRRSLEFHLGMDTSGPRGTHIFSTGPGRVVRVTYRDPGYGNSVTVEHEFGYRTLYAHMTRAVVRTGQKVRRGQLLGYMGATGRVTGVHLHYELWKNSQKVDPLPYVCATDLKTGTCRSYYNN